MPNGSLSVLCLVHDPGLLSRRMKLSWGKRWESLPEHVRVEGAARVVLHVIGIGTRHPRSAIT